MNYFRIKTPILVLLFFCLGCESYLNVDLDKSKILSTTVFSDDQNVESAVNGVYQTFKASAYGGGDNGIATLAGLSADELNNVLTTESYNAFETNNLLADDGFIESLWTDSYKIIYQTNDILENLRNASKISDTIRDQATGEALFVRAFTYFYLTNLFGAVPLVLTTDYRSTSVTPRIGSGEILSQVTTDLNESLKLMSDGYVRENKTRPNWATAKALLARVTLYQEKWQEAELAASDVISMSSYALEDDLNNVFRKESAEIIWQLAAERGFNSKEGSAFIIEGGVGSNTNALTDDLVNAFEIDDQRFVKWTSNWIDAESGVDLRYLHKYKEQYVISDLNAQSVEFYVVFRLAEMYLIRAESRMRLGNLSGAISDLNVIRNRAGLKTVEEAYGNIDDVKFIELLQAERRVELMGEWGHRWLDLKRSNLANEVLGQIKDDWSRDDMLYPVPQSEFLKNPFLGDQNDGY